MKHQIEIQTIDEYHLGEVEFLPHFVELTLFHWSGKLTTRIKRESFTQLLDKLRELNTNGA